MIQLHRRTIALALAAFLAFAAVATTSLVLTLSRDADAGSNGFTDTPPWIAAHAAWLSDNGIASGFPGNLFKPNDNITRGQAAFWFGNYNNALEVVKINDNPEPSNNFSLEVPCPAGKRAIAGGGFTQVSGGNVFITDSYSFVNNSTGLSTWVVDFESEVGVSVDPQNLEVQALCAPETLTG